MSCPLPWRYNRNDPPTSSLRIIKRVCEGFQHEATPYLLEQPSNNLITTAPQTDMAKLNICSTRLGGTPISLKRPPETEIIHTGSEATPYDVPLASTPSTSGRVMAGSYPMCSESVVRQVLMQEEESKQFISAYAEQMRCIIEGKMRMHTTSLLGTIQNTLLKKTKEKEDEIERAILRNMQLVEQVKQLMVESQLWQSVAQRNELIVSSLRSSLEKIVAQGREHGHGEGPANDDAESCNIAAFSENKHWRNCRACGSTEASVLLLPCRHLCLCRVCDARQGSCPICGALKNASVHVQME